MALLSDWHTLSQWLEVPHEHHRNPTMLINPDLEPMPPARRVWGFFSFFGYWAAPNVTIWTWSTGSALVALGLSIHHIMGALTLANILICVYTCLNSVPGYKYHVGYPVTMRMIFGIYGSSVGIIVRILLSVVFYGSQSWLGGVLVVLLLSGLSKSFMNLENTFPESVQMTSRDFVGFVVFLVTQTFFFAMKPEKINSWVIASCATTMVVFVAMLAMCSSSEHGVDRIFHQQVELSASRTAWMWLYAMSIWYGAVSPDCTNQNDYSRFASSPTKMHWGIISSVMTTGTFVPLAGLLCASATKEKYGSALWLPTDIVLLWLNQRYSARNRTVAVIFGLAFAFSQLTFNVVANGFAGGMDLAGIYPKYINIRRGAFITALLSWVVQPWKFYNCSSTFLGVMSSFGVVTTPIIAILVADFLVVRNSTVPLLDLYSSSSTGVFYFSRGFHWRAIFVWLASVALSIPGLVARTSGAKVPAALENFYFGGILFAFVCPFVLYLGICFILPPERGIPDKLDVFGAFTEEEQRALGMEQSLVGETAKGDDLVRVGECSREFR